MIDEIRAALGTQGVTTALIIDDLYDSKPGLGHIEPDSWANLLADLRDAERALIAAAFPGRDIDQTWEVFTQDQNFLDFLWAQRSQSTAFSDLFTEYESNLRKGRADLAELESLLRTTLGFTVSTAGSATTADVADLVFMDLFLGPAQDTPSMRSAIARVKDCISRRAERPPMVVLMSSSTRLEDERIRFRNEADILGCQFRVLNKSDIQAREPVLEVVHRLVSRYVDTLRFAAFVEGWQAALSKASRALVRRMRRLDLRDYADLQSLILDAEDESMGSYLLELYNRVFQYELEGDEPLAALATDIDKIDWADYPPPHFLPAEDGMDILDNVFFHHVASMTEEDPISLGDVLFRTESIRHSAATTADAAATATAGENAPPPAMTAQQADAHGEVPAVAGAQGECLAMMVMTQSCDIQRGVVGRYLLLPGVARPMDLKHHKRPDKLTTPVLRDREASYVVEWLPETGAYALSAQEMQERIESGRLRRVRRFRSIYALQLQQEFASKLTRIGTISVPPVRHAVAVTVYLRGTDKKLASILEIGRRPERAVVLVGRDDKKEKHQLAIAPSAVAELRSAMVGVVPTCIHANVKAKWSKAIAGREIFRALERGIEYNSKGTSRPFKGESDIIEVVGPFVPKPPRTGIEWPTNIQIVLHISSSEPLGAEPTEDVGRDSSDPLTPKADS